MFAGLGVGVGAHFGMLAENKQANNTRPTNHYKTYESIYKQWLLSTLSTIMIRNGPDSLEALKGCHIGDSEAMTMMEDGYD